MSNAIVKKAATQVSKQLVNQAANVLARNVVSAANTNAARNAGNWASNRSKQLAKQLVSSVSSKSQPVRRTRGGNRVNFNATTNWSAIAPVNYATVMQGGANSLRVRQTEIIGKIGANTSGWWSPSVDKYSVFTLPINPANPTTFPWLSYIARLYDKYRFHSLTFRYINSVPTATRGNFMMALDYDTLDKAPSSLIEGSQLAKYQLTPVYVPTTFKIPVSHPGSRNWLYTFDLSATTNTVDLKTYNLGNLFIALDGLDPNGPADFGYLAVEYDVELIDKNPVISDFASKTFDNATKPVTKALRSSVDPADTMEVTTTYDSITNVVTFHFSDDCPAGAKARIFCSLPFTADGDHMPTPFLGDHFITPGCSILDTKYYSKAPIEEPVILYNLDITVPDTRLVELELKWDSYPERFLEEEVMLMAYTYN